jgi:tetratricopeptide (TPR) repeat protein
MPASNKIQVHFRTETVPYLPPVKRWEHRIAVYPIARDEVLWQWRRSQTDELSQQEASRLATSLSEHWLATAEKLRSEYRFIAAIDAYRQVLRFNPLAPAKEKLEEVIALKTQFDDEFSLALKRLPDHLEATRLFNRILAIKPDLAQAHGRLGTLLAVQGQQQLAIEHWQKVSQYDPNDAYGEGMLGWNAYLQGRYQDAIVALQKAEDIEPFNAKINLNLGLALAQAGRMAEAISCFRNVVSIEPQNLDGYHNLSLALQNQQKPVEAIPFAVRATKLAKDEAPELLITLAEVYFEANRPIDANNAAQKAEELVRMRNSTRHIQLHTQLKKLRERIGQAAK